MFGVVIGASSESVYAIKLAQNMNCKIIAFDGDKKAEGLKYADISYVVDIRNPKLIIEKLNSVTPPPPRIFVLPIPLGRYLTTVGYINDYYKLNGISEHSCILCTDKLLFHKTLNSYGLRSIECVNLQRGRKISDIKDFSFPLIVKPRYGSGSRNVNIIETPEVFQNIFLNNQPYDEDYIIESFYDGEEYGIDGVVIDNSFQLVLLRKKKLTPPPFRQCVSYISIDNNDKNKELINHVTQYMKKVIKALEMNNCILHADIIIDKNMNVFAIEVSGRPSGHNLHNLFTKMATNIDMIEQYIKFISGLQYDFTPENTKKLAIHYFDFEDCIVKKVPDKIEILKNPNIIDYKCNIEEGHLGKVTDGRSIMNRGYFIVKGDNEDEINNNFEFVLSAFKRDEIR